MNILEFFYSYNVSYCIASTLKWYVMLFSVMGIIASFWAPLKETQNEDGKRKIKWGVAGLRLIFIVLLIGVAVLLIMGTFNIGTVPYYSDHGTYIGQEKSGKAHGNGRYYDKNENIIYIGEFKENLYDGKGKLHSVESINGEEKSVLLYEGDFEDGRYSGEGTLYQINGLYKGEVIYKGEFYDGKYNGKGEFFNSATHFFMKVALRTICSMGLVSCLC